MFFKMTRRKQTIEERRLADSYAREYLGRERRRRYNKTIQAIKNKGGKVTPELAEKIYASTTGPKNFNFKPVVANQEREKEIQEIIQKLKNRHKQLLSMLNKHKDKVLSYKLYTFPLSDLASKNGITDDNEISKTFELIMSTIETEFKLTNNTLFITEDDLKSLLKNRRGKGEARAFAKELNREGAEYVRLYKNTSQTPNSPPRTPKTPNSPSQTPNSPPRTPKTSNSLPVNRRLKNGGQIPIQPANTNFSFRELTPEEEREVNNYLKRTYPIRYDPNTKRYVKGNQHN